MKKKEPQQLSKDDELLEEIENFLKSDNSSKDVFCSVLRFILPHPNLSNGIERNRVYIAESLGLSDRATKNDIINFINELI